MSVVALPSRTSTSTSTSIVLVTYTTTLLGTSTVTTTQTFLTTTTNTTTATETLTETLLSTVTATESNSLTATIVIPQDAGGAQKLNFNPSTVTVTSGTAIQFVDEDSSAPHNVYFTSIPSGATNPNGSGSPILTQGSMYSVTLTTPGTYTFECQFHSGWMQGTITVTLA